jgi:hypothetical protein
MWRRSSLFAALILGLAGIVAIGFIPGVGILFLGTACVVAIASWVPGQPVANRSFNIAVWFGALISIAGAAMIPLAGPIVGASVFVVGLVVSVLAAIWRWLVAVR